ncbi:MAG TPA: B12-binding domain-containing radical SAM protein, partial [Candidatus Scatomorpha intestinigallinarum]|nr:B12-binding domain-containing radical SAM protein [Candidatus Scatomorpha intestinigallinarum]
MDKRLERILPGVQKPARYTGGEYNEIIKDKADVKLRMAFCFPDVYEIGMSNLGMRILYGCINAEPDIWCERVFAPWGDMAEQMRANDIPLYALESGDHV